jgi:hypothetical protein
MGDLTAPPGRRDGGTWHDDLLEAHHGADSVAGEREHEQAGPKCLWGRTDLSGPGLSGCGRLRLRATRAPNARRPHPGAHLPANPARLRCACLARTMSGSLASSGSTASSSYRLSFLRTTLAIRICRIGTPWKGRPGAEVLEGFSRRQARLLGGGRRRQQVPRRAVGREFVARFLVTREQ